MRRLFVKGGFVFRRGEVIFRAMVVRLKLRVSLDRPIVGKECNRIVTLDGNSIPAQILQFFGCCHRRQASQQYKGESNFFVTDRSRFPGLIPFTA